MKCKVGHPRITTLLLVVTMCLALLAPAALAQDEVAKRIVPVVSPQATCMAVHEPLGLLVVGHRGEKHLSVYKLDAKGALQGEPKQLALPMHEKLKGLELLPTSVVTHPKLPLIYVRMDVDVSDKLKPRYRANADENLDHLVIYELAADGTPTQRGLFAKGSEFDFGFAVGDISITPEGSRLYMPHFGGTKNDPASIGFYDLQEDGMPAPKPVPIEGSLDGMGLSQFDMKVFPQKLSISSFAGGDHPSYSVLGVNSRIAFFSVNHGLGMWDTEDRRGEIGVVTAPGTSVINRMGPQGHWPPAGTTDRPGTPAVYLSGYPGGILIRFRHAYGYPTMLHQNRTYGGTTFYSQPIVLGTTPAQVVLGGQKQLHAIELTADGDLGTGLTNIPVDNDVVRTLAWSPKYDKLYVPVAKIEEPKP